jgi:hypothetical protein
VDLATASITAAGSTSLAGYGDPKNIIHVCNLNDTGTSSTWLVQDNNEELWQTVFEYDLSPTAIQIYNTNMDGRGTKTWRFVAQLRDGGQMQITANLSYTDPATGQ